ncbi:hypothetical protein LJK88_42585 [Paenibacillus sp. P26]|nr:hypothetical protein LJK88_42585 [Paenibacillus sp. P26]
MYQIVNGQKVLKSTVSTTTVTFTNMAPGDYTYEVHTVSNRFGESADGTQTDVHDERSNDAPPSGLTYKVTNGNDVTLNWTSSANATGYKVYQVVYGERVLKSTVSGLTVTYSNLPGGDYDYVVNSYSSLLGESPDGAEVTFTLTLPVMTAPANLTNKITNGNDVVLSWTSVPYATSYKVYELVGGQETLKTTVSGAAATLTNVPAGDHTYVVRSVSTRYGESVDGEQHPCFGCFPDYAAARKLCTIDCERERHSAKLGGFHLCHRL